MQCNHKLLVVLCFDLSLSLVKLLRISTTGDGGG